MDRPTILVRRLFPRVGRRPRRGLTPAVRPLEGRRLLTGGGQVSATMTQTVTFPDLESQPNVATQGVLYFGATMGTLTEVDVVTSGSFNTQFGAENLASSGRTIQGTTTGNLSIHVPTGAIPVVISPVTESFKASAFDGKLDDAGTSGKTMAPVASNSTPQTTVLTSPADLAAFTGHFDIPISVTGHATGAISPSDASVSDSYHTQTSATITIIYHYVPNPTDPAPSTGAPTPPSNGGGNTTTNPTTNTTTGTVPGASHIQAVTAESRTSSGHAKKHAAAKQHKPAPHRPAHPFHRHKAKPTGHSRHLG